MCCLLCTLHVLIVLAAVILQWVAYGNLPPEGQTILYSNNYSLASAILSSINTLLVLLQSIIRVCTNEKGKQRPPKKKLAVLFALYTIVSRCISIGLSITKAVGEYQLCNTDPDHCQGDVTGLLISVPILESCSLVTTILVAIYGCCKSINNSTDEEYVPLNNS